MMIKKIEDARRVVGQPLHGQRMLTLEGFEMFCDNLTDYIKRCIADNQGENFEDWLIDGADLDFQHGYESCMRRVYKLELTNRTRDIMRASAKNIVYGIQAYVSIHDDAQGAAKFAAIMLDNQLFAFKTDHADIVWED